MSSVKNKVEPEYPAELETQFVLRLPEEPAKTLREVLKTGENLKNRLTIQVESDMRHGEVRFDQWLMHAKILDLPTVIESLKTIDSKSFYKSADLCQMMICKEEPDPTTVEEETTSKNKKKDPYKVDKKFLWPHGITPPTKNVRKRRFRKTLKKKSAEAPEIEKEVKRLLRADNEAVSVSWEIIQEEEDDQNPPSLEPGVPKNKSNSKVDKKQKSQRNIKREQVASAPKATVSNVDDIFGGALSDSDLEEDNINVETEESRLTLYDSHLSDTNSIHGTNQVTNKKEVYPIEFKPHMFQSSKKTTASHTITSATSSHSKHASLSFGDDFDYQSHDIAKDNMTLRIQQLKTELDELKQRRQRTQHEISGMENMALRRRFQDILHTLNQDIMYKEMEYQGTLTLQNSEDI